MKKILPLAALAPVLALVFVLGSCENNSYTPPPVYHIWPPTNEIALIEDTWANGDITNYYEGQWFVFTASANTQTIFFETGTLNAVFAQLYTSMGGTAGGRKIFYNNTSSTFSLEEINTVYYIRITPYYNGGSGTYKIAFNASATQPPIDLPENPILLAENEWEDGYISAGGEQWFQFQATAETQYIHFKLTGLDDVLVQLYDSDGRTVGNRVNLYGGALSLSRKLEPGNKYYIKVKPYNSGTSGAYRIVFNKVTVPPLIQLPTGNITLLTEGVWAEGEIAASGGEQWFSFTATAAVQFIHFKRDTLYDVNVQIFDNDGFAVGDQTNLYVYGTGAVSTSRTVTNGNNYFIKITPYSNSGKGAYNIAFNKTPVPIDAKITELTAGVWSDGDIVDSGNEEWFPFIATGDTQYIHFKSGTLGDVYIRLYDTTGKLVGGWVNLYGSTLLTSLPVTNGNDYFIRVSPYTNTEKGTYKLAFSTSAEAPSNP
jgi:hypothetical protein